MQLPAKTRVLNVIRRIFKIPALEALLARQTRGKPSDSLWCKLLPNPYQYPSPTWRTVTRHGIILRVDIADYMGYIYYFGIENEGYEQLFGLCKSGHYVIDVGANMGWTLLNLGRLSRTGRVVGFEPDPRTFDQCQRNLQLNNMPNVTLLPYGLGDVPRAARIDVRSASNSGGNRIAPTETIGDGCVVDVRRLDDIEEINQFPRVDLIKIDVEGYELKVLKGAKHLLQKHKPVLFIEVDDDNLRDQGDSAGSLISFLRETGYTSAINAETGAAISPLQDFSNCHFDLIGLE